MSKSVDLKDLAQRALVRRQRALVAFRSEAEASKPFVGLRLIAVMAYLHHRSAT